MVSSDLLDIVIGVVFAWFLLSLIVSFVGEAFTYLSKTRSKLLWRSLSQIFDASVKAADPRLRSLLFLVPFGKDDLRPVANSVPSASSKKRQKMSRTDRTASPSEQDEKKKEKTPSRGAGELYEVLRRRVPDTAGSSWRTRISQVPTKVVGDALLSLAATTVTRQSLLASIGAKGLRAKVKVALDTLDKEKADAARAAKAAADDAEASAARAAQAAADATAAKATDAADKAAAAAAARAAADVAAVTAAAAATGGNVVDRHRVEEKLGTLSEKDQPVFDDAWKRATEVVTLEDIEALLAENPRLVARVRAAAASVAESEQVQKAREEIERWFDGAMEGLSAFYRRQSRKILAIVALIVVMLSNSGAFHLYQRLHDDNGLRVASASAAAGWAAQPLTDDKGAFDVTAACARVSEVASGSTPTTAVATTTTTQPATAPTTTIEPVDEARRRFKCAGQLFASTDLLTPLGPHALWTEIRSADTSGNVFVDLYFWGIHPLLGRIVTWVALLFGAGFWYDALRRLIGLKGKLAGNSSGSGNGG